MAERKKLEDTAADIERVRTLPAEEQKSILKQQMRYSQSLSWKMIVQRLRRSRSVWSLQKRY